MNVALHDADSHNFPNLVLMKLSAWHKAKGDKVCKYIPLFKGQYDLVYSSKVFTFTRNDVSLPESAIKGGTGYGINDSLPDEIEHGLPDYSLYPDFKASYGFTTRGCIRACPWCIVPKKEGKIREHADIQEFLRSDSNDVILMDNNILASEHGIRELEKSIELNLRVDCNQGSDARLIAENDCVAKLLSRVHWLKGPRLACDRVSQIPVIEKAVKKIREFGNKQFSFFVYVLVENIPDALERVEFLRKLKVDPFAQPYRDFTTNKEPAKELKRFARWVNHKAIFKTVAWTDYNA